MSNEFEIVVGELTGYRYWMQDLSGVGIPLVYSLNGFPWPTDTPTQAKCGHNYGPPSLECNCGIYTFANLEDLISEMYISYIFGSVHLWGTVIKHQKGYRAQFAKITGFFQTNSNYADEHLQAVAKEYNVPLLHIPTSTEIITILTRQKLRGLTDKQRAQVLELVFKRRQELLKGVSK